MTSLKSSYGELLALTQLYLLRECEGIKSLPASPDARLHYQKFILPKAETKLPPPAIKSMPAAAPIQIQALNQVPHAITSPPASLQLKESVQVETPPLPCKAVQQQQKQSELPIAPPPPMGFKQIALSALAPYSGPASEFKEMWTLLQTHFNQIALEKNIPGDGVAKKIKNQWQEEDKIPPILILSFDDRPKSLTFLKNIAKAISLRLSPARVINASKIELEKQWGTLLNANGLKLIIASDYGFYLQPQLMEFHQENPQEGKHFLNHIPTLLLSDLEFYFKNGKMKAYLWRAICTEFAAMRGE
jgi:hypothetical protein